MRRRRGGKLPPRVYSGLARGVWAFQYWQFVLDHLGDEERVKDIREAIESHEFVKGAGLDGWTLRAVELSEDEAKALGVSVGCEVRMVGREFPWHRVIIGFPHWGREEGLARLAELEREPCPAGVN